MILLLWLHCPRAGPGPVGPRVGPARPYEGLGRARVLVSWPGPHRVKGQGSGLGLTLARPGPTPKVIFIVYFIVYFNYTYVNKINK